MNPLKWRSDLGAQCVRTHLMVGLLHKGKKLFLSLLSSGTSKKKKKIERRLLPFEREDQSLKMLQLLISNLNP